MPIQPMPRDIAERLTTNIMDALDRMDRTICQAARAHDDEKARQAIYRLMDGKDCSIGMLVRVARLLDTTASELLEGVV